MADYVVFWDGRRDGPGGAFLFADAEAVRQEPEPCEDYRSPAYGAVRLAIEQQLRQTPQTMRELVRASGITMDAINSALYTMRKRGEVLVVAERPRSGRAGQYGRSVENVYGWAAPRG